MSNLSFSEQERLKQLEREVEQAAAASRAATSPGVPQAEGTLGAWVKTWGRPLLTALAILACMLGVGLFFRVFGTLLQLVLIAGLGYLLYAVLVAPRLGFGAAAKAKRSKQEGWDLDRF